METVGYKIGGSLTGQPYYRMSAQPHSEGSSLDGKHSALNEQVGGEHYKGNGIQPIEFILSRGLNFCEGNVIKYVCRHEAKNGIEDLKKAKHYLEMLIELKYVNDTPNSKRG